MFEIYHFRQGVWNTKHSPFSLSKYVSLGVGCWFYMFMLVKVALTAKKLYTRYLCDLEQADQ